MDHPFSMIGRFSASSIGVMMATADLLSTTSAVRQQYESYPYPQRNPADEKDRFLFTHLDDLATLNFYCYRGERDFRTGFRALVAGGGTGDSTIHLAEQLRGTDAVLVHLDLSQASIEIARRRAEVRGLDNVTWIQGSLLDLPASVQEPFDYINCSGVLHHLPDPRAGLQALKEVLAKNGALGLMLYGKYGRTGIYQMQELMRIVNQNENEAVAKIDNARKVVDSLPESNWYRRSEKLFRSHEDYADSEIYDLLLHSVDQPFSVADVYDVLEAAGLELVEYLPEARALYDPRMAFSDPQILDQVLQLPRGMQQAAAEIFWGTIKKHDFWASADAASIASFENPDQVPFFSRVAELKKIPDSIRGEESGEWSLSIEGPGGITLHLTLQLDSIANRFVELADNTRTLGEIEQTIAGVLSPAKSIDEIHAQCRTVFETLRSHDLMLLRHQTSPLIPTK